MGKRILSGALIVAFTLPMLVFSSTGIMNTLVALISAVCLYEALIVTKYVEAKHIMVFSLLLAVTVPFMTDLSRRGIVIWMALYAFVMFILIIVNFPKFKFQHICVVFMLSLVIPYFFSNIVFLRRFDGGGYYICLVFIGAWFSDTAALLFGMLFGRHKLCPNISPKKTVEGSIGGVVGATLGYLLFGLVVERFCGVTVNYLILVIAGALASGAAQLGDLSASVIKRTFGVKDFGKLIPGHGGMLDRFDSVLFVAPYLVAMVSFFPFLKGGIVW